MGESTPEAIELECPGCSARFRLRPTKGRLPKGPINCPECATPFDIPSEYREGEAPQAQVLRSKSEVSSASEVSEVTEVGGDNTAEVKINQTMMGRPVNVSFDDPRASEKTRAAPSKALNKALDESSEKIPAPEDSNPEGDSLRETAENAAAGVPLNDDSELSETSESVFNNTTKAPWDNETSISQVSDADESAPSRAKSSKETRPNLSQNTSAQKPKLSDLLKKVREKKSEGGLLLGPPPGKGNSLTEGLDELLDDTATALNLPEESEPGESDSRAGNDQKTTSPGPTAEMKNLRNAISPGMASEKRGSGYIRIPTAEIMDVLGEGKYRLRVDDVVYEPVDEKGLARLIKGGVLMGAEEIAEEDGDWLPVADHPVVQKLRRKMADQAHLLLAEVAAAAPQPPADDPETEDLDLDQLMSEDILEEASEAPPPIPPASQSSDTIETGPPEEMTLPGTGQINPDDLPDVGEISELMANAQAEDPFAERADDSPVEPPGLTAEPSTPLSEPSHPADGSAEENVLEGTYPAVTQESAPTDGAGAPIAAAEQFDADDYEPASSSSKTGLIVAMLLVVFVAGGAAAAYFTGVLDPLLASEEPVEDPTVDPKEDPVAVAEVDAGEPDEPVEEVDPLEEAQKAWESSPDAVNAAAYAGLLIEDQRYDEARRVIVKSESSEELDTMFNDTLTAQFGDESPVVLTADAFEGATAVRLRKRSIVIFEHQGRKARFIPDAGASIPAYRASIASYRLCQAALCGFSIPRVVPARISADEWTKAAESIEGNVKTSFRDVDGTSYLEGAIQYEVESKAFFPMYLTSLWRDWLDGDKTGLDQPLAEALEPAKNVSQSAYENLVGESSESTTREFAAQTASIIAFDYLTNNFARFDKARTDYDHGVVVDDGEFFSVDNLDTWRPRASTRVKGRFSWTRRFNRKSVESLRSLEKDTLSPLLFSNPSSSEKTALRVFWSQRDRLLDRVDSLVKSNGEEDVYFE